jgi:hypothetical protein
LLSLDPLDLGGCKENKVHRGYKECKDLKDEKENEDLLDLRDLLGKYQMIFPCPTFLAGLSVVAIWELRP